MFQENDERYLEEFGRRFPSLKRVLIDERNQHMSQAIRQLASGGKGVVAQVEVDLLHYNADRLSCYLR